MYRLCVWWIWLLWPWNYYRDVVTHRLPSEDSMWTNQGYQSKKPHSACRNIGHFRAWYKCITKWDEFPFFIFQSLLNIDFFPLQLLLISSNFPTAPNNLRCLRGKKDICIYMCGWMWLYALYRNMYSFNIHTCTHRDICIFLAAASAKH